MTLRPPVDVPTLDEFGPTHFIAIGGAGMSGIARLVAAHGIPVSGSDAADSPTLRSLSDAGVTTHVGHAADQLGDARSVVVSSAIREDNVELVEARRRGLRVMHRSVALAALMSAYPTRIAVTGTHGKTTTTAMVAQVLTACGSDPSYVVGGTLAGTASGARRGHGDSIVVEADESDGSFLQYDPTMAVITNVEADHLDNWGTPEAYAAGFVRFAAAIPTVVVDTDDPGIAGLTAALVGTGAATELIGYGETADPTVRLSDLGTTTTGAIATAAVGDWTGRLQLRLPGRHNVHNAAAALAVAYRLGLDPADAAAALSEFGGTSRRFQLVAEVAGIRIVDDYAHHPTELAVNVAAAREGVPAGGRLVVCFQPHLFSRTRDFAEAFGRALSSADLVVVLGIYPAREDPIPGVTGRLVSDAVVGSAEVHYVERLEDAVPTLARLVRKGDVVLTAGAGNVATVGPLLAARLTDTDSDDTGNARGDDEP